MTGKKTVILVAWNNETKSLFQSDSDKQKLADNNIALLYTGIGKNNASNSTHDIVGYYDRVINVGCAGTHTQELETYSRVTSFVERDVDCRGFGYEQYQTPEEDYIFINFDESGKFVNTSMDTPLGLICGSGDNSKGYSETSDLIAAFDAVDMEAYAMAKVCMNEGIEFHCFKYYTDKAAVETTIEELIERNTRFPWTQIIDEILFLN